MRLPGLINILMKQMIIGTVTEKEFIEIFKPHTKLRAFAQYIYTIKADVLKFLLLD